MVADTMMTVHASVIGNVALFGFVVGLACGLGLYAAIDKAAEFFDERFWRTLMAGRDLSKRAFRRLRGLLRSSGCPLH